MDVWDGTTVRGSGIQRAPDRVDWDGNVVQTAATQTAVNTNISNIATNVTGVSDNVTDIGTNTGNVSTNVTNIATNVSNIGTNDTAIANLLAGVDGVALHSVGAVETVSGLAVAEYGDGATHKTVLTLTAVDLETVDGTDPPNDGAWAALKLYTFPAGTKISTLSHFKVSFAEANAGSAGFTATSDFDIGLGSVAVAQAVAFSLSGTQSDYNEATVALSGGASTDDTDTQTTVTNLTSRDLYLNLRIVDDADHGTANGIVEVTGVITITWTMVE